MDLRNHLLNLRNKIDFGLRDVLRWSRPVSATSPIPAIDYRVQKEFEQFLKLFNWKHSLAHFKEEEKLSVADVGARNFCFAPVIDHHFEELGRKISLSGIEIDSYRRLSNLHTRYDYGIFYANQCREAAFHPIDFLKFQEPLHLAFLLNPFVSDEPTLQWGLPLSTLKPEHFFEHAFKLLKPQNGLAILSCPSPEEFEVATEIAEKVGFKAGEEVTWKPQLSSQQRKPRLGLILNTH